MSIRVDQESLLISTTVSGDIRITDFNTENSVITTRNARLDALGTDISTAVDKNVRITDISIEALVKTTILPPIPTAIVLNKLYNTGNKQNNRYAGYCEGDKLVNPIKIFSIDTLTGLLQINYLINTKNINIENNNINSIIKSAQKTRSQILWRLKP